jgi:hypothetical protein
MEAKQAVVVAATKSFYILVCIFLAPVFGVAQNELPPKEKRTTAIEILYDYYQQTGNHSAVTGGIGTEELKYNAPVVVIYVPTDSLGQITVKAGVDAYSSASQDNIDFNISSASAKDARTHVAVAYSREKPKKQQSWGANTSGSVESDYLSFGLGGFYSKGWHNYNTVLSTSAQVFFDDTRWGWLSSDPDRQLQLIFPEELRGTDWFDHYKRYTTTLSIGLTQLLTPRLNIGFFVDGVWQNGLLSTTFHRVYLQGQTTAVVENLPKNRYKLPLAMRLNWFATRHFLLRSYYRFYTDNWGIQGHTIEVESSFKLSPFFSIIPFYRLHWQDGSTWFNAFGQASANAEFFTSDFDLSRFTAHKFGIGINYAPLRGMWRFNAKGYGWQGVQLRIGSYLRSDGLEAFYLSSIFYVGK